MPAKPAKKRTIIRKQKEPSNADIAIALARLLPGKTLTIYYDSEPFNHNTPDVKEEIVLGKTIWYKSYEAKNTAIVRYTDQKAALFGYKTIVLLR